MQFEKYVARVSQLEDLIKKEKTGSAVQLASKIGVSRRMLMYYLDYLKTERNLNIEYSRILRTYKLKKD